ncbi:MAG TPA: UDP-N-acetylglucosamine 1-carboxyvinyltransferase [Acidimicrobiales bacterium]|nr:UDP-N-acetylglucosamine 1-carboxyvinyltransferase [Acidimicrobiales bacterium]
MSRRIVVRSGAPLSGDVAVSGAKNSVLKCMAATLLAPGRHVISNVAAIEDVTVMGDVLSAMGVVVDRSGLESESSLVLDVPTDCQPEAPYELAERIRASIVVLGPLLARFGRAKVPMPGGDDFGSRPIDMHIKGLEALGADIVVRHGDLDARADRLRGGRINLDYPSVGATENLLMASVLAKGTTVLDNAAREPEIGDLVDLLTAMGARIDGKDTSTLTIEGVDDLHPTEHVVIPDRVEAATYATAVGLAEGGITIRGARLEHMDMLAEKLGEMGVHMSSVDGGAEGSGIWVTSEGRPRAADVSTLPYPGIATDYKPFLLTLLTVSDGVAIVTENVYGANRYAYVAELVRMGADIRTQGHHAVVRGVPRLSGAPIRAHDIRAGAALVLAGLAADGTTVVHDAHHVERGYADLVASLRALGADVGWEEVPSGKG